MPAFYKWQNGDLLLSLYVQPKAKNNEIVGEYGDNLKIRITALPVNNKANKHLLKFLAKTFAVPSTQVKLIKGINLRTKHVKIFSPYKLPELIKRP